MDELELTTPSRSVKENDLIGNENFFGAEESNGAAATEATALLHG